ncbi:MAG: response regulator transcription factor [Bifidobacterium animalis]|nr:response regulator transcription factor [Bifidobacterium animalis]
MKVAIVDDDPIVCSSIGTILTTTGTAEVVWTAHDGAAAVVAYARQKPDVLLIDVQMPGTDGLEASERILVLTTFADPEYIRRAIELGTKGYLIKQDVASVIPAVQAVMAGQVVLGADVLRNLPMHDASGNVEEPKASPLPDDPRFAHLTDREHDIVELVAEELDNREIAAKLFLSEGTVRNRISHIHDHHIEVR